jgi:glycosyltransferase involved in cell wall biosynthesis
MSVPTISVIIPLYKTERFLEKCLRSVMAQTFRDIEIICVDDCSPDRSAQIVRKIAKEDSRIVLVQHSENIGLGGARNTGIIQARARYIASIDSDDYIAPTMLQDLYAGTKNEHFDVVVCGYERVNENGDVLSKHQFGERSFDPIPNGYNPYNISNPAFWNKLWRTSLYIDNDIFFPNHIYYQDAATTPRIYAYARSVNFIGGTHYKYLMRNESVTNNISDKHMLDKFRELDFVKNFFIERGLFEKYRHYFSARIFDTYRHHYMSIAENNPDFDEKTLTYLRHLLLMRESYSELGEAIRSMSAEQLGVAFQNKGVDVRRLTLENSQLTKNIKTYHAPRPWSQAPEVLVLTLHFGENEYGLCKESLQKQSYRKFTHKVFSDIGNVESNQTLYDSIMDSVGIFHLFLKLDADMVFADDTILEKIVAEFTRNPELDHLIIACDDWMTGKQIIGVHAFSNRVTWDANGDGLFLEPTPKRPGKRKLIEKPVHSYFYRSHDPSAFQAFHFGTHCALKLIQKDRSYEDKRVEAMTTQWDILVNIWNRYSLVGDRRHGLALLAAHLVITGRLGKGGQDYKNPELKKVFDEYDVQPEEKLKDIIYKIWANHDDRQAYFTQAVGVEALQKLEEHRSAKRRTVEKKGPGRPPAKVNPLPSLADTLIRSRARFRVYTKAVSPFLDEQLRRKLRDKPSKFFKDAKHPVFRFGRWLHRKDLI